MSCFLSPSPSLSVRVGTISEMAAGKSFILTFTDHVEGRYVTLILPGSKKILTLCEVEVYGYRAPTGEILSYYIHVNTVFSNSHLTWGFYYCIRVFHLG